MGVQILFGLLFRVLTLVIPWGAVVREGGTELQMVTTLNMAVEVAGVVMKVVRD